MRSETLGEYLGHGQKIKFISLKGECHDKHNNKIIIINITSPKYEIG